MPVHPTRFLLCTARKHSCVGSLLVAVAAPVSATASAAPVSATASAAHWSLILLLESKTGYLYRQGTDSTHTTVAKNELEILTRFGTQKEAQEISKKL